MLFSLLVAGSTVAACGTTAASPPVPVLSTRTIAGALVGGSFSGPTAFLTIAEMTPYEDVAWPEPACLTRRRSTDKLYSFDLSWRALDSSASVPDVRLTIRTATGTPLRLAIASLSTCRPALHFDLGTLGPQTQIVYGATIALPRHQTLGRLSVELNGRGASVTLTRACGAPEGMTPSGLSDPFNYSGSSSPCEYWVG